MILIFRDEADEWRFRVSGANGEIVATSEGYTRKADAWRGLDTLKRILAENNDGRELSDVRGNGGDLQSRFDGRAEDAPGNGEAFRDASGDATGDPVERAGE